MRDLIVFALTVASLPFCFRIPFFGLLMFSWLAYMRPQDLCWGFAATMRLSLYVGVTLIAGYFANDVGRRPFMKPDLRAWCMIAILCLTFLSTALAEVQDSAVISGLIEFTKIIGIALLVTGQLDSPLRLRLMLWTIGMCLGFFGFKGGLYGMLGGGGIERGPGGMMEDNNDFALALVMSLPINFYLGVTEKNLLLKKWAWLTMLLTCVTVILTHSRGGYLAMACVFLQFAWRSGKLLQASLVGALAVVAFFQFAPKSVLDEIATIGEAAEGNQDKSVDARYKAWAIGLRMIQREPILGVGHKNFRHHYGRHAAVLFPGEHLFNHVAHNSYIQMWAETGTFALLLFLVMLFSVIGTASRLRRIARMRPDLAWARGYGNMAEATTVGYMVGGFFLNRAHFDLVWHWMGIVTAMSWVARTEWAFGGAADPADKVSKAERPAPRPVFDLEPGRAPQASPAWGTPGLPRWERGGGVQT